MILLLGKRESVEGYIRNEKEKNESYFYVTCPSSLDHHSEYGKYIPQIRLEKPQALTTQSLEMVDTLLESDLEFDVVTLKTMDGKTYERRMEKKEALMLRDEFNIDLRD